MSTSDHFANWCCTTVLPEPNGPGTAAVPPLASGNMVSMMRWPVISGCEGVNFRSYGRATRTGHFCMRLRFSSPFAVSSTQTVCSTVKEPDLIALTVPAILGGTMILCRTALVSCTVPITSPPETLSPFLTVGVKAHFFSRFSAGTCTPRAMVSPQRSRISVKGR